MKKLFFVFTISGFISGCVTTTGGYDPTVSILLTSRMQKMEDTVKNFQIEKKAISVEDLDKRIKD